VREEDIEAFVDEFEIAAREHAGASANAPIVDPS
jgi:hypothetical protein